MARIGFSIASEQINKIIDENVIEFEQEVRERARGVYEGIVNASPFITYYYKANHNLSVREGGKSLKTESPFLDPPIKESEEPGIYESLVSERVTLELKNLQLFKIGDTIRISTLVPYADRVEANHGVYARADEFLG